MHVWIKPVCDGERFAWDNRHNRLAFPNRDAPGHSTVYAGTSDLK
jgi:hypothetical protein